MSEIKIDQIVSVSGMDKKTMSEIDELCKEFRAASNDCVPKLIKDDPVICGKTIFDQQEKFMKASGQTTGEFNLDQFKLYSKLVCEEYNEFIDAVDSHSKFRTADFNVESPYRAEISDALCDLIVVAAGALHSLGVDVNGSWQEVIQSNLAKIDKATGKVIKRSDGKVLKPDDWKPPELTQFVRPCSQNK